MLMTSRLSIIAFSSSSSLLLLLSAIQQRILNFTVYYTSIEREISWSKEWKHLRKLSFHPVHIYLLDSDLLVIICLEHALCVVRELHVLVHWFESLNSYICISFPFPFRTKALCEPKIIMHAMLIYLPSMSISIDGIWILLNHSREKGYESNKTNNSIFQKNEKETHLIFFSYPFPFD